jgi:hypothetical protein
MRRHGLKHQRSNKAVIPIRAAKTLKNSRVPTDHQRRGCPVGDEGLRGGRWTACDKGKDEIS